jgi:ParB/RepB/Spo0J family partition protein
MTSAIPNEAGEFFDGELPELDLLSHRDDPDAAVRLQFLDPANLIPNDINRTFTDDDLADLLASVPVVGFLQAAVVVPLADQPGQYRVLIGNRRRAAAERLNRPLPSLIVRSEDTVQEILAILSENDDRLSLKPTQKAALYQQLTLLDWKPEQIAKARGVKPSEVRAALTLVDLPTAAQEAADAGQLELDLAPDLAEFADDPKTMTRILQRGRTSTWGLRHVLAEERSKRVRRDKLERLRAELLLAGVKMVAKPKTWGWGNCREAEADTLLDSDGNRLNQLDHHRGHRKALAHARVEDRAAGVQRTHQAADRARLLRVVAGRLAGRTATGGRARAGLGRRRVRAGPRAGGPQPRRRQGGDIPPGRHQLSAGEWMRRIRGGHVSSADSSTSSKPLSTGDGASSTGSMSYSGMRVSFPTVRNTSE